MKSVHLVTAQMRCVIITRRFAIPPSSTLVPQLELEFFLFFIIDYLLPIDPFDQENLGNFK